LPVNKTALEELALSEQEYQQIVKLIKREPTIVELGLFGSLWSEHCGYKHSKLLLKLLPSRSKWVTIKPGEENAGAVNIGDGKLLVMKMESHNHPSAIEPYQGAATGVGGIVRDIFTMGARPIALTNSLRFGPLSDPHNRFLLNGVVGGIAGYGNCLGIPDIAGDIYFAEPYSANPLVNALCLGIADENSLVKARATGVGNTLMLVGSDTGRDGIHGASGLASRTFEDQPEMRSAVQVGNPFMEKLLIEACLELAKTDWIVGMQDCGAAGLTSSTVEMAEKGESGIEIDVLKVPRREKGMTPYEVMLSESQERMVVVVKKGYEDKVRALFDKWDLHSDIIGQVTSDGLVRIKEGDTTVAEVSARALNNPPLFMAKVKKPGWVRQLQELNPLAKADLAATESGTALLKMLASPNIASKLGIYRQYDHQVMNNTVIPPGGDAALIRIKETRKAVALTSDGNGRYCQLDPNIGGAIAVAEAARNVVCTGALPVAITDCLNLGNPERSDVYYQLKEVVRGISRACRALKIPVISGNVSLYNETNNVAIFPTPAIGLAGVLEDVDKRCTAGFKDVGDHVYLLGGQLNASAALAGSEYQQLFHNELAGKPEIDLKLEARVQRACRSGILKGTIKSAHDISDGGLAVAIAESCIIGGKGLKGRVPGRGRLDARLFGEGQSQFVVSVAPRSSGALKRLAGHAGVPLTRIGVVTGGGLRMGSIDLEVADMEKAWRSWRR
jgi:phosphoribosylformylglycinamidine synthase subunit PurL